MLSPKKSAEFIASQTDNIKINNNAIETLGDKLIDELKSKTFSSFSQSEFHPNPEDPWALEWIFVVDTLNFCFWKFSNENSWTVENQSGYFALCAAINRSIKEDKKILDPKFFSTITEKQLENILKGDTDVKIPLFPERLTCLHEVGNVLLEKFEGSVEKLIKTAENSAVKLLSIIVENFKCFRDEAEYQSTKVSFYKRAQIFIGDIWSCFNNKGIGYFKDIEKITMFADYRVPQVLIYFNVMEYNEKLLNELRKDIILKNGDKYEVEIRGCSIHAVELLKEYILSKTSEIKINSILIDHYLWDFRRKHATEIELKNIPFHKTFSIYY